MPAVEDKANIMETKGRRSVRASGPTEAPAARFKPVETSPPANGASEVEPPKPAKLLVEAGKSTETAVDLAAAAAVAAPKPSIGALPPTPSVGALPSPPKSANRDFPGHFEGDAAAALAQSQAALARGLEALSAEMAGLALSGMNVLARTATKLLAVKTLSDAIEVNAGFTCSSLETLVGGSAKLSELGVKLAAETSQPLFGQLARGWSKAARPGG
ncbi:MAG: phasin family protein [Alphaproteobacteria bacterium]|nr:phasin family protein [Alphaproteobacteria bacterium]